MHDQPLVAIVGEPNVGKSTLLNKIAGRRFAVTSKVAGTTRDRQYIDTSWNGVDFTLVDTAGITFGNTGELETALNEQIDIAVVEADVIVFVVDGKEEVNQLDRKALLKFRKIKKPIVLVVNKLDSPKDLEAKSAPFQRLGIKPMFTISSISGRGIGDLLDHITDTLLKIYGKTEPLPKPLGIAISIVGKPNVGKSSILNRILGQKRAVVSSIPGTTRTAIDTHVKIGDTDYTFIDTAGLKRKEYNQKLPDIYSGFQTFRAIRRSDIVFFVIDATLPLAHQDQHIAGEIFDLDKGVVILANKMDAYDGDEDKLRDYISMHFPFLWFAPLFFVSAETGAGISEALAATQPIFANRHKQVDQEEISKLLAKTMKKNPPKWVRDQKKPKVFGLTQTETNPPLFELYVNHSAAISEQYRRYLQKTIIKQLDFYGTPVNLRIKSQDKK
jgi:GTP-binding protein